MCTYLGFRLQKSSYIPLGLSYHLAALHHRATTVLILKATIPVQSIGIQHQKLPIREMDPKMKTRRR